MALGRTAEFNTLDISGDNIRGMIRGMSQALAIGLQGQDVALARALAGRVVAGVRARDSIGEIERIFHFVKTEDGGVLRGEQLVSGMKYAYNGNTPKPPPGTYQIIRPGGGMSIHRKVDDTIVAWVPPSQVTQFRVPAQPWEGLRYTSETIKLDTYQTFARSIEAAIGDCDDHAIAVCTLAKLLGFTCGFKLISTNRRSMTHVYAIIGFPRKDPTQWVAMDTTDERASPGWDPANLFTFQDGGKIPHVEFLV